MPRIIITLLLCALMTACGDSDSYVTPSGIECDEPTPVSEAEAMASAADLCEQERAPCLFEQSIDLAKLRGGTVVVSPARCAEDLPLCRFAVWHEFGHLFTFADEPGADCFAAENASADEVDAAICYFDSQVSPGDNSGLGDGNYLPPDERAQSIADCRP